MHPAPLKKNPTLRFSDRVEFYIRSRPKYPPALLTEFVAQLGLRPDHLIADIGSGTGFLSELFLGNGNAVYGVEPNAEMCLAGEAILGQYSKFTSVDATAEATTLPAQSMDFIIAGQAFHWFDPVKARQEFLRILRPGGIVALIWNDRRLTDSPFSAAYQALIDKHNVDHDSVHARNVTATAPAVLGPFFGAGGYQILQFDNSQSFDFDALLDRVASSSYMPMPGQTGFDAMRAELKQIFDASAVEGRVSMMYDTRLYWGRLG